LSGPELVDELKEGYGWNQSTMFRTKDRRDDHLDDTLTDLPISELSTVDRPARLVCLGPIYVVVISSGKYMAYSHIM